jgi:phenylacetate-CoA ligase
VARDDLGRAELLAVQARRLARLLHEVLPGNPFHARKLAAAGLDPTQLDPARDWPRVPRTTRDELLEDQARHPPYGSFHPLPLDHYRRLHQTSGTSTGAPLRWLDTAESWEWMLENWAALLGIAGVRPDDRLLFAFSFGPFIGFWTAFEAAQRLGCLCLAGGGMSSVARLRLMRDNAATVILCTPTYALRLAEVARSEGIDLAGSPVRALIVAGEPGGSVPGTRARIESAWGARVFDHTGMTECGPLGIECPEAPGGLHLLETEFLAEVHDAEGTPVPDGTPGELVLTTLGRDGSPLVRYRTGDLVCVDRRPCPCRRALVRLDGGIRGRLDDVIVLRGNNFHPSALQGILHHFPEVAEYRVEIDETGTLPVLRIEVEPTGASASGDLAERVEHAVRDTLLFRAEVRAVPPGTLPRFEMKARRVVRKTALPPGPS